MTYSQIPIPFPSKQQRQEFDIKKKRQRQSTTSVKPNICTNQKNFSPSSLRASDSSSILPSDGRRSPSAPPSYQPSEREMGSGSGSSRELLNLEHSSPSKLSTLEAALLVCGKKKEPQGPPRGKPFSSPLPKSQVLGRAKDFLGLLSESNKRLEQDAKDNADKYNIEVPTGDEPHLIEMDLTLGIADLLTPEAVAAAESAIAAGDRVIHLDDSESESGDSSDDDDESNEKHEDDERSMGSASLNLDISGTCKRKNASGFGRKRSRKASKIVEMP